MSSRKRGLLLLILLGLLSPGCASTRNYPFREKPRPQARGASSADSLSDLQRELSMYSD